MLAAVLSRTPTPNTQHPTPNTQRPTPTYEIFQDLRSKQEEEAVLSGARRAVLDALIKPHRPVQLPAAPAAGRVIQSIIAHQKKYWKSL